MDPTLIEKKKAQMRIFNTERIVQRGKLGLGKEENYNLPVDWLKG